MDSLESEKRVMGKWHDMTMRRWGRTAADCSYLGRLLGPPLEGKKLLGVLTQGSQWGSITEPLIFMLDTWEDGASSTELSKLSIHNSQTPGDAVFCFHVVSMRNVALFKSFRIFGQKYGRKIAKLAKQ